MTRLAALILSFLVVLACTRQPTDPKEQVVAKVNGE